MQGSDWTYNIWLQNTRDHHQRTQRQNIVLMKHSQTSFCVCWVQSSSNIFWFCFHTFHKHKHQYVPETLSSVMDDAHFEILFLIMRELKRRCLQVRDSQYIYNKYHTHKFVYFVSKHHLLCSQCLCNCADFPQTFGSGFDLNFQHELLQLIKCQHLLFEGW